MSFFVRGKFKNFFYFKFSKNFLINSKKKKKQYFSKEKQNKKKIKGKQHGSIKRKKGQEFYENCILFFVAPFSFENPTF